MHERDRGLALSIKDLLRNARPVWRPIRPFSTTRARIPYAPSVQTTRISYAPSVQPARVDPTPLQHNLRYTGGCCTRSHDLGAGHGAHDAVPG
eukprot:2018118-Rhodomonas_salina.1